MSQQPVHFPDWFRFSIAPERRIRGAAAVVQIVNFEEVSQSTPPSRCQLREKCVSKCVTTSTMATIPIRVVVYICSCAALVHIWNDFSGALVTHFADSLMVIANWVWWKIPDSHRTPNFEQHLKYKSSGLVTNLLGWYEWTGTHTLMWKLSTLAARKFASLLAFSEN